MSDTSSATPRETLPVTTASSTLFGIASAIACATSRNRSDCGVPVLASGEAGQEPVATRELTQLRAGDEGAGVRRVGSDRAHERDRARTGENRRPGEVQNAEPS